MRKGKAASEQLRVRELRSSLEERLVGSKMKKRARKSRREGEDAKVVAGTVVVSSLLTPEDVSQNTPYEYVELGESAITDLEIEFVSSCNRSADERVVAACRLAFAINISKSLRKFYKFGIPALLTVLRSKYPAVAYARLTCKQSLTMIMASKTEEALDADILSQCAKHTLQFLRRANDTVLLWCLTASMALLDGDDKDLRNELMSKCNDFAFAVNGIFCRLCAAHFANPSLQDSGTFVTSSYAILAAACSRAIAKTFLLVQPIEGLHMAGCTSSLMTAYFYQIHVMDQVIEDMNVSQNKREMAQTNFARCQQIEREKSEAKEEAVQQAKRGLQELKDAADMACKELAEAKALTEAATSLNEVARTELEFAKNAVHLSCRHLCYFQLGIGVVSGGYRCCSQSKDFFLQHSGEDLIGTLVHTIQESPYSNVKQYAAGAIERLCQGPLSPSLMAQRRVMLADGIRALMLMYTNGPSASKSAAANALCEVLESNKEAAGELLSMRVMDPIKVLVDVLQQEDKIENTHSPHSRASTRLLAVCATFGQHKRQGLEFLAGERGLNVLLHILLRGDDCAHLAARALASTFASSPASDFDVLMRLGGVRSIMNFIDLASKTFEEGSSNPLVLIECFRCIHRCCLSFASVAQDIVLESGGLLTIFDFCCERGLRTANEKLQLFATRCLSSCVRGNTDARAVFESAKIIARIRNVLSNTLVQRPQVLEEACRLVEALCSGHERLQNLSYDGELLHDLRGLFLNTSTSQGIQAAALSASAALCHKNYKLQDHLRETGLLTAALNMLHEHEDKPEAVRIAACTLIHNASMSHRRNRKFLRYRGANAFLCSCFEPACDALRRGASLAISKMIIGDEISQKEVRDTGGVSVLVAVLSYCDDQPTLDFAVTQLAHVLGNGIEAQLLFLAKGGAVTLYSRLQGAVNEVTHSLNTVVQHSILAIQNGSFRCPEVQNEFRKLGIFPMLKRLLEHCVATADNRLLTQILTCVSSLCKGNCENKLAWRACGGSRAVCDVAGGDDVRKAVSLALSNALRDSASSWDLGGLVGRQNAVNITMI